MYLTSIPAYVYKITCHPTGQFYYGFRESNIKKGRMPINDLWVYYFTHSKLVRKFINQYGKDSFLTEILYQGSAEEAFWKEQENIKIEWKNPLLLNKQFKDKDKGHKIFRLTEGSQERRLLTRARRNPNKIKKVRTKLTEAEKIDSIKQKVKIRYQNGSYHNLWLAKTYKVISPDGEISIITNMAEFCRSHGLSKQCMNNVINGKQLHHKGWRCNKIT